ncbi:MAG: potassium transporter TrkG [Acidimicrobiales bacterium]
MSYQPARVRRGPRQGSSGFGRPQSYSRLAVTDGLLLLGIGAMLSGLGGAFDDRGDAVALVITGLLATGIGVLGHRSLERRHRPAPGRVLGGLALTWLVLVVIGTGIYLVTGGIGRVDDALVESAAGFSSTNLTTVNHDELSVAVQLWRAATQWIGGLLGILAGVVALPLALRGTIRTSDDPRDTGVRIAPTATIGRRRILTIYATLTAVLAVAYAIVGLSPRISVIHALTTISTGGFSSEPDSFAGLGTGARLVAVIGMTIAGTSYVVMWWAIRGRIEPVWRSTELRAYLGILAGGSLVVFLFADGIAATDAIFTTVSAVTTTGFAVNDWTVLDGSVLMVLLMLVATGAMSGGAGGGLHVARAWMLLGFSSRELRRQLDPQSVVVVKQSGTPIDEGTLEGMTGYQIAHLGLCALAAVVLAAAGLGVIDALYTGISVLSTFGPGVGPGAFGDLGDFSAPARVLLVPFMLAGRLSVLPLLLGLAWLVRVRRSVQRRSRRLARAVRR